MYKMRNGNSISTKQVSKSKKKIFNFKDIRRSIFNKTKVECNKCKYKIMEKDIHDNFIGGCLLETSVNEYGETMVFFDKYFKLNNKGKCKRYEKIH